MSDSITNLIKTKIILPLIEMDEGARVKQQELIAAFRLVSAKPITSKAEADALGIAARDIRTHVKQVRDMAKSLRDPLFQAQKDVIKIENAYCDPLETELTRGERLVTDYAEQERKRVEAEERARQAEIERLRIQQEEAAKLAMQTIEDPATSIEEKMDAEVFQQKFKGETRAVVLKPEPVAHKVSGASTKKVLKHKVTDKAKLYAARPELFKEPELKLSAVNSTCFPKDANATKEKPDTSIPGLEVWWEAQSSFRAW